MKKMIIILIMLAFSLGFLSSNFFPGIYLDKESPYLIGYSGSPEQPGDWIPKERIKIEKDRVIIYVENAKLSSYAPTGSMLPTLGENANGIKIVPTSPEEIKIGDIITFKRNNILMVHRVISKGEDSKGDYFVTKGDNNSETDGKVYWEDVESVTIALIY